jgi:hypothetical protein
VTAWSVEEFSNGELLKIVNPEPEAPLNQEGFSRKKLIALTDASTARLNWGCQSLSASSLVNFDQSASPL